MEALAVTISLGSLVVIAISALVNRNLLVSVILMSVFSLISALLFYLCDAPDVAITEAAVGAGVSTLIYVWAIHRTRTGQEGIFTGEEGEGPWEGPEAHPKGASGLDNGPGTAEIEDGSVTGRHQE